MDTQINWQNLEAVTATLVNITLIAGAFVAVLKLRLYNLLSHRFRSEVVCSHTTLADGRVLFSGDYIIHNTGERQIWLERVCVRLLGAETTEGNLIRQNEDNVLAERIFVRGGKSYKGLHRLEAGERSIFPLRCIVDNLDEITFFSCRFEWPYRRTPSPYISIYIKSKGRYDTDCGQASRATG